MIRHTQAEDISRIAEIIVFGKRVAYRPIFQDDINAAARRFYERNGFRTNYQRKLIEGTQVMDIYYEKFL